MGTLSISEFKAVSTQANLTTAICGLGGMGVVGLTRLMAEALLMKFPRVATVETRGIAQRRAPVRSMVRAGATVRSASAPDTAISLAVSLEATEALRIAPALQAGACCLHADVWVAPSGAGRQAAPDVTEIRRLMTQRGIEVVPLNISQWLHDERLSDVLVSTAAFGMLARMIGLPTGRCADLLLQRLKGKVRDENQAAFEFGVRQLEGKADRFTANVLKPAFTRADQFTGMHAGAYQPSYQPLSA